MYQLSRDWNIELTIQLFNISCNILDDSLSISKRGSWLGLRPHQLSRDRNIELII